MLNEICPLLDQPYNKHVGLINHIFISSTSHKIIEVVMTKPKYIWLLKTIFEIIANTIITWNKTLIIDFVDMIFTLQLWLVFFCIVELVGTLLNMQNNIHIFLNLVNENMSFNSSFTNG
jgi:hypothetical protein